MIDYPDIAGYQQGLNLDGAQLVVARSSIGCHFNASHVIDGKDTEYQNFKAQANAKGIPFVAYHFLYNHDGFPISEQAATAFSQAGPQTPLMMDVESDGSPPQATLEDLVDFINQYRALGGVVKTAYIPHWFWESVWDSRDIGVLASMDITLISSNYRDPNGSNAGFQSYGGMTPKIWQYSDNAPFNGQEVDFNRYMGSLDELKVVFGLVSSLPHPSPTPGGSVADLRILSGVDMDSHGQKMKHVWELLLPADLVGRLYITSAYRAGPPYHGALDDTGALDIAGPVNDQGNRDMRDAAKLLYDRYGDRFLEIIHTTPFADDDGFYVKNGQKYPGGAIYGDEVPKHLDHIHTAAREGQLDQIIAELQAQQPSPEPPPAPVPTPDPTPPPEPSPTPPGEPGNGGPCDCPDLEDLKVQVKELSEKLSALVDALHAL